MLLLQTIPGKNKTLKIDFHYLFQMAPILNLRIIVNPEFVEGLDISDGAEQFDPEDQKKFEEAMEINEIED